MYIINIMWLVAPIALLTILGVACYCFYEEFFSNQYISLLISLSCIGLGGFINLIVVYLGIAKLKRKNSKEELLRLQHDIEKNIQVEDKWLNMLFSYTADRWIVSDVNADLFSKLDENNFEENDKTKNVEENLARTINYMSNVLYNQLKKEVINFKEAKFNEFATYIQAEKILLDNIDELRENMYNYIYKIKRRLREIKE
ncbi:hypothetical protein YWH7199_09575 [Fusobacterium nucleatum YWH7199]|uniref:Uncharacterized protein n=1 Tax=Fusobacterium nucleatum TaxID=851 RepID=A0A133NSM6_FUSNU|nr:MULTISPECIES: hypothetical protein [Fusobacterium]KXA19295.1 hypothetical protein HMPREF3221_01485 [Fusobacterium nucleatum]MCL4581607.1 hypothetical protein [Fusobacterium nucleatum YWH7199]CDA07484.1 uncharacterized protein BN748_01357 [Fusobacterium sp. CAG:649]